MWRTNTCYGGYGWFTDLERERLSEVHAHTAIVFPEHSPHATGHSPEAFVLLRLSLHTAQEALI